MSKKRSALLVIFFLLTLLLSVFIFRRFSQNENQRFVSYTAELFRQEASSDTITLHYTLKNPSDYNISDAPVSYGLLNTDTTALCAASENALAVLHSYRRDRLSEENQLTYDILEFCFEHSRDRSQYNLYQEPLAPLTGTQSQLPVILSEYRFYNEEDCNTYLELLAQTPEYFRSIIAFEKAKSEAGLFMADYNANDIIEECETFLQMGGNNYLYSSFEERLQSLNLSDDKMSSYIETNRQQIATYVFPAYQELIDALKKLCGTGNNNNGLCYFPDGKSYYEALVESETGSSRSIPELQQLTLTQMAEDSAAIQETLAPMSENLSSFSDIFNSHGAILDNSDPAAILSDLKSRLSGSFPDPPQVDTQIKYVQESMEEYLSPAFYMIPPIDGSKNNVIYINRGHMPDDLSLFTTLAHEGYPGHLYQTVYYASTNPDPIRSLMSFGGYTEGWATYTEMISYYYAPVPKEQATLLQRNASIILGLYALADMGIHYDGWTLLDTVSFFRGYGITDTDTIEDIYNLIIADPANYLKYYIGYVEFLQLKKEAIQAWGKNFSQEKFHKAVLDAGPAPFTILNKKITGDISK